MSRSKARHPWFRADLPAWKKRWQSRSRYIWNRWSKREKKRAERYEEDSVIQEQMEE